MATREEPPRYDAGNRTLDHCAPASPLLPWNARRADSIQINPSCPRGATACAAR